MHRIESGYHEKSEHRCYLFLEYFSLSVEQLPEFPNVPHPPSLTVIKEAPALINLKNQCLLTFFPSKSIRSEDMWNPHWPPVLTTNCVAKYEWFSLGSNLIRDFAWAREFRRLIIGIQFKSNFTIHPQPIIITSTHHPSSHSLSLIMLNIPCTHRVHLSFNRPSLQITDQRPTWTNTRALNPITMRVAAPKMPPARQSHSGWPFVSDCLSPESFSSSSSPLLFIEWPSLYPFRSTWLRVYVVQKRHRKTAKLHKLNLRWNGMHRETIWG